MPKSALTPEEQIIAAYSYFVDGVSQRNIATIMRVHSGRVCEACRCIGSAVGLTPPGYKDEPTSDDSGDREQLLPLVWPSRSNISRG
jgi:hypothetical protein